MSDLFAESPLSRAFSILNGRAYTGKRGGIFLDGKMVTLVDVIREANTVLASHKMPLIHYPNANPIYERKIA